MRMILTSRTRSSGTTCSGPIKSDDYDLRFFDCQSQYVRPGKEQQIIDNTEVDHCAGYNLIGRTEVEPLPLDPDFKKTGRFWLFALYPVLAPQETRGTGLIRYRYADPNRGDDSWDWNPGSRRVRRLNEALLGTMTGAQTNDPDHYLGFNPKTEQHDYKFLGEKEFARLGTRGSFSGGDLRHRRRHFGPRIGSHAICTSSRRRHGATSPIRARSTKRRSCTLDSEVWFEPCIDTYDQRGQLWRTHIYWLAYRDRPVPDACIAIYPFKREFVVGAARSTRKEVSLRSGLSTNAGTSIKAGSAKIFHGPGDGSSIASRMIEAAGRPNPPTRSEAARVASPVR
jgi:hypothetical protein